MKLSKSFAASLVSPSRKPRTLTHNMSTNLCDENAHHQTQQDRDIAPKQPRFLRHGVHHECIKEEELPHLFRFQPGMDHKPGRNSGGDIAMIPLTDHHLICHYYISQTTEIYVCFFLWARWVQRCANPWDIVVLVRIASHHQGITRYHASSFSHRAQSPNMLPPGCLFEWGNNDERSNIGLYTSVSPIFKQTHWSSCIILLKISIYIYIYICPRKSPMTSPTFKESLSYHLPGPAGPCRAHLSSVIHPRHGFRGSIGRVAAPALLESPVEALQPIFRDRDLERHGSSICRTCRTRGWVKTLVPSEPQNSWDLWMWITH